MKRFLFLLPVFIHRLTGWLPFQPKQGKVQFANVGEGALDKGIKTYLADANAFGASNPGVHFMLYKAGAATTLTAAQAAASGNIPMTGAAADFCTLCTAITDTPLGTSDDACVRVGDPLAINLFGAVRGTVRCITDGTVLDGSWVCASSLTTTSVMGVTLTTAVGGMVALWTSGNGIRFGKAVIPSDCTAAKGDVIQIIPILPLTTNAD